MTTYLIIEDDVLQRENLTKIIKEINPMCLIFEADNKTDAINIARDNDINIIFVDIMLNGSNGIDFAKDLRKIEKHRFTWIVFITTHSNYMMDAFKQIHCYDYILKPYNKDIIKNIITTLQNSKIQYKTEKDYVVFNKKDMVIKICIEDIFFIEVNFRTCTIHTKTGVYLINRMSLKSILEKIKKDNIIKIHRSYAININEVDKITKCYRGCWEVSFKGYNNKALMTESFKEKLLKQINILS